jgi:hypothetical protein
LVGVELYLDDEKESLKADSDALGTLRDSLGDANSYSYSFVCSESSAFGAFAIDVRLNTTFELFLSNQYN